MVACYHDTTNSSDCKWSYEQAEYKQLVIDFDIWFVNGDPRQKHINPFEHQFSFELHDIFELYLSFFIFYTFLIPVQCYALSTQKHALPLLLTVCMCLEYVGVIFNFIHVTKFAVDGIGISALRVVGNFIDMIAQCFFMLLLLLVVKGWSITRRNLTCSTWTVLLTVWAGYAAANVALFVWNQVRIVFS